VSTFKELQINDVKTSKSFLNQLIEIVGEDISSSVSRRAYEHFITGGVSSGQPGATSSLFHTVYDQDYTLQTANPLFDVTIGLNPSGSQATGSEIGTDVNGKRLYPSHSLMMREKGYLYRQYAQLLLGTADGIFTAPLHSTTATDEIDAALFINIKRLFHRDQLKRGALTLLIDQSGSISNLDEKGDTGNAGTLGPFKLPDTGSVLGTFTDSGGDTNKLTTFGGAVSEIRSGTSGDKVGLNFVNQGILVLDMNKVFDMNQAFTGTFSAVDGAADGTTGLTRFTGSLDEFVVSASIDDVTAYFAATRFGSDTTTKVSFQNITNINSTLYFCRATADEFNYSSNPTFINNDNEIQVIESGQEDVQKSFTFITSVGLYDANNNLLAVAKLSRPVEKNAEKDLTIRSRIDFAKRERQAIVLNTRQQ
tara:strand:+ start:3485 stop:4750 length:1266 start_codon:yes stop_codon:yes gene_type:complete